MIYANSKRMEHLMRNITVVLALGLAGCVDDPVPTEDFGPAIECKSEGATYGGVYVDHGYRALDRYDFEAACMPRCNPAGTPCEGGLVFYTVPVEISEEFPSGNLCYCDRDR